jgi:plasmid maintenance system killer protein
MDIVFGTPKLKKIFNSEKELVRECGPEQGRIIMRRMAVLRAANNLEEVSPLPPERRHELSGDRNGQFAVDLKQPNRLVFKPNHAPVPLKDDGGYNLRQITAITIIGVVKDYHQK